MKRLTVLIAAAAAAGAAIAVAQTSQPIQPPADSGYYGGGYPVYTHASTAAEGAARGMADVVRSQGQANLNNSAAAINYSIARSNQIKNREAWTSTYFQMRDENRRARAAERRPRATMEDLVRYAQAGKPKPLSPSELDVVSGAVRWPMVLQVDTYADGRAELEKIYTRRASSGTMDYADYMKVREVTKAMLAELQKHVRDVPPQQYLIAKQFLQSLAFESNRPAS